MAKKKWTWEVRLEHYRGLAQEFSFPWETPTRPGYGRNVRYFEFTHQFATKHGFTHGAVEFKINRIINALGHRFGEIARPRKKGDTEIRFAEKHNTGLTYELIMCLAAACEAGLLASGELPRSIFEGRVNLVGGRATPSPKKKGPVSFVRVQPKKGPVPREGNTPGPG